MEFDKGIEIRSSDSLDEESLEKIDNSKDQDDDEDDLDEKDEDFGALLG